MQLQRQSNGQRITITTTLGTGGEARVCAVQHDQALVAKIYHRPTDIHGRKLAVMLANPPLEPDATRQYTLIVWPLDLLYTVDGSRRVVGHTSPQARPDALTWRSALDEARAALMTCSVNAQHRYGNHLRACPWCDRTAHLGGRDPFPSREAVQRREHLRPVRPTRTPPTRPARPVSASRTRRQPLHLVAWLGLVVLILLTAGGIVLWSQRQAIQVVEEAVPSGETWVNSLGVKFVLIPAGTFQMGSDARDAYNNEKPVHQVTLSKPFYLGIYEVTQGQWQAVMGTNPSHFQGDSNLPVENVSWDDVQEFLRRLNTRIGGATYRLPTAAEWEYAARVGTTTAYSFGDDTPVVEVCLV
jgi:Sulfatase-modifying factor enzyme 1